MNDNLDMDDNRELDQAQANALMQEYFELNAPAQEFEPTRQTSVSNCSFKFRCPKRWEDLEKTKFHNIRFCNMCLERVFFCRSESEVSWATQAGLCVVAVTLEKKERRVTLGVSKGSIC